MEGDAEIREKDFRAPLQSRVYIPESSINNFLDPFKKKPSPHWKYNLPRFYSLIYCIKNQDQMKKHKIV